MPSMRATGASGLSDALALKEKADHWSAFLFNSLIFITKKRAIKMMALFAPSPPEEVFIRWTRPRRGTIWGTAAAFAAGRTFRAVAS